jgi:hypothetical protein
MKVKLLRVLSGVIARMQQQLPCFASLLNLNLLAGMRVSLSARAETKSRSTVTNKHDSHQGVKKNIITCSSGGK